uniref:Uncharacterized protein n=1 Tax=Anguilla anguilla TaxID=7936 RepID=A0A0E9Y217_ANGAN
MVTSRIDMVDLELEGLYIISIVRMYVSSAVGSEAFLCFCIVTSSSKFLQSALFSSGKAL